MTGPRQLSIDDLAARVPHGASVTFNKGDESDVPMALAISVGALAGLVSYWMLVRPGESPVPAQR